jgi:hypothetical protein
MLGTFEALRIPLKGLRASLLCAATVAALWTGRTAWSGEDAADLSRLIDERIGQRLDAAGIPASPLADDAEFIRRVYLDVVGVIPPPEKVMAFLESDEPDRRAALIDELLADPRYGRRMADVWTHLTAERTDDNKGMPRAPLHRWFEAAFNRNRPWDELVYDLLTVTGTQAEDGTNGAVTFFVAEPAVDKLTDKTTRLFLGVRLECAQCHDHAFTTWKQADYWGLAAFFTAARMTRGETRRGTQPWVTDDPSGPGQPAGLPDSALSVPARFLGGEAPRAAAGTSDRQALAAWVTATENPYFARAMVNRVWASYFGRGLVNPVDDMLPENEPSHPELFDELTEAFVAGGFDVKHLVRAVCNSQSYQRTHRPLPDNADDVELYSHRAMKLLTAEQLFDSLQAVTGTAPFDAPGMGPAGRAVEGSPRVAFAVYFSPGDPDPDLTAYLRGIPHALRLMNSPLVNDFEAVERERLAKRRKERGGSTAADAGESILDRWVRPEMSPAGVVEGLYLTTLSRRPTAAETDRLTGYVRRRGDDPRRAYSDILWALMHSSEFSLNH